SELVDLLRARHGRERDPARRVQIARRIASIEENRRRAPGRAFEALIGQLPWIAKHGTGTEQDDLIEELSRLASRSGREADLARTLQECVGDTEPQVAERFLLVSAQIWHLRVHDSTRAESVYRMILSLEGTADEGRRVAASALAGLCLDRGDAEA